MAGATQRRMDQTARPGAGEGRLSHSTNKVVRLPRAPDPGKSRIADEDSRRERLTAILTKLVQQDVVPRLLSSTMQTKPTQARPKPPGLILPAPTTPIPSDAPTQDAIVEFTDTLLNGGPGDAAAVVGRLRHSGIAAQTLCLHLLTGAARHLGDLWVSDEISFADVTLATDELQLLFRDLAPDIALPIRSPRPIEAAALLVSAPGEQHSFGLSMLATFFRAAGWTAQTPKLRNAVDVQRRVAGTPFDLLGFSLGAEVHLTRLGRCIEVARRSSRNRDLVIMVGGPVFIARPELATLVGADATALDAVSALAQAERLVRARLV